MLRYVPIEEYKTSRAHPTPLQNYILDFIDSGESCAEINVDHYASINSAQSSWSATISRLGLSPTLSVRSTVDGRLFLLLRSAIED